MKSMKQEQGFTMIEALLSLLCASFVCMLITQCAKLTVSALQPDYEAEDRLAIKQLQLLLAQSDHLHIVDHQLHFTYHQEEFYLTQYENRLVKRKGFEVIMQEIDRLEFQKQGSCYQMVIHRKKQMKKAVLACEE